MGTNYYLHTNECANCHREDEPLHIGKSSAGWCFGLHVHPDIQSLEDWKKRWAAPGVTIKDEYGDTVSPDEMERIVTQRGRKSPGLTLPMGYGSIEEFLKDNHAAEGPNALLRHDIDGTFCIGHGEGTWDLLVGEFS